MSTFQNFMIPTTEQEKHIDKNIENFPTDKIKALSISDLNVLIDRQHKIIDNWMKEVHNEFTKGLSRNESSIVILRTAMKRHTLLTEVFENKCTELTLY